MPNQMNGLQASRALIAGDGTPAGRNLISGNIQHGVYSIPGGFVTSRDNYIGTDASGLFDLGNGGAGLRADGGGAAIEQSIISGNASHGIHATASGSVRIEGSRVGTAAGAATALPNGGHGLFAVDAQLEVGGRFDGEGNVIAFHPGDGIRLQGASLNSPILRNRIYANGGLGINLVGGTETAEGVTLNDGNDADTGPNNLQNYPVFPSGIENTGTPTLLLNFQLNSTPGTDFRIELFTSPSVDPSGFGEGATFVTSIDVTTDGGGTAAYLSPVPSSWFRSASGSAPRPRRMCSGTKRPASFRRRFR